MKLLNKNELPEISGGEIIAGWPSADMVIINTKLMIAAGRGQPGFDVGSATAALMRVDPEFWNHDTALEYVRAGDIPLPTPPSA